MKFFEDLAKHISLIRSSWNTIKTNRIIVLATRLVILLSVVSIILLIILWHRLPPQVPLWYSRPWGEGQLAHPAWLFLLPLGSLFWLSLAIFCSVYVTKDHLTFNQIVFLSTVVASLLSCITLVHILFLIT